MNQCVLVGVFFAMAQYFANIRCPVTSCVVIHNHTYLPTVTDYDALAFFHWNWEGAATFPAERDTRQLYVLLFTESPVRSKQRFGEYSNRFNLTMSYRWVKGSYLIWH